MKLRELSLIVILFSGFIPVRALSCDLSAYKAVDGIKAEAKGDAIVFN